MAEQAIVVLCTVPSTEVAERLGHGAVEGKLAACVNIVPGVRSIYEWEGKLEDDQELLLVVKTTKARYLALEAWLTEQHPYDVPEVVALDVTAGSRSYLDWVLASTQTP